jgi:uncharacterized membrane protein SpoIIM required for sporulation
MIITVQFSTILIFLLLSFIVGLFFGFRAQSDRKTPA